MRHAGRHDDRLARSGHVFLAVESEVGFARQDGSTQSEWPAAMTMTGSTKAATRSMTVATVIDRALSMRR